MFSIRVRRRWNPAVLAAALAAVGPTAAEAGTLFADQALCTLGDAIEAANLDVPIGGCPAGNGADLIFLGYQVVLEAADTVRSNAVDGAYAGLPEVTSDVKIVGLGAATIRRNHLLGCTAETPDAFRLFNVGPGGLLELHDLHLSGGCVVGGSPGRGGAIHLAGSVGASATLVLSSSNLTSNRVLGLEGAEGGAIAGASAEVVVGGSSLFDNEARSGSLVGGDAAGGAVALHGSSLVAVASSFWSNVAAAGPGSGGDARGGALSLWADGASCTVDLDVVYLVSNSAIGGSGDADGGAASGGALAASGCGSVRISRTDLSFNRASGGSGGSGFGGSARGGAVSLDQASSHLVLLDNSLFYRNETRGGSSSAGQGGQGAGGGLALSGAVDAVTASSFVYNVAGGGAGAVGSIGSNAAARGGGLYLDEVVAGRFQNLTIAHNHAGGGTASGAGQQGGTASGGGVHGSFDALGGATLSHLTIVGNSVLAAPDASFHAAGAHLAGSGSVALDNVLLAGNLAHATATQVAWDIDGAAVATSNGYNRYEDDRDLGPLDHATDAEGEVTGLGGLTYQCAVPAPGGTCRPTVPLEVGSNVVDQGSCLVSGASHDGRGVARPFDLDAAPDLADGCDPGAFELALGRVVVALDTVPDAPRDFGYQASAPLGYFELDDDDDPVLPNQRSFEVLPGQYSVDQVDTDDYEVFLACVDPTADSSTHHDVAFVQVAPHETVTCTFRNEKATVLTFVQETVPLRDVQFNYSGDLSFAMNAWWQGWDRQVFRLVPGTYEVSQQAKISSPLTGLACVDSTGDTTVDLASRSVNVKLAALDSVTCTFTNSVPSGYFTVTPCRVYDTRVANDPLSDDQHRGVPWYALESCGVPPTASAVALNVTAVAPSAAGHLALFPSYSDEPQTSVLNFPSGRTRANNAIVGLGPSFTFYGFNLVAHLGPGVVDVVIDVAGFFQ